MRPWAIAVMCSALWAPALAQRPAPQPIIDVHRHASWPGTSDAEQRAALLADMDAEGIVLSLLHINEPGDVQGWAGGGARTVHRRTRDVMSTNPRSAVLSVLSRDQRLA